MCVLKQVRARKALMAGHQIPERAVNWMLEHGDDLGIDDPIPKIKVRENGHGHDPPPVGHICGMYGGK